MSCLFSLLLEGKEALWLLLKPPRIPRPYSSVIVVGVYYPPGQSKENEHEMLDYLTQKMDIALDERHSAGIFVTGDFNKLDLNPLCRRFNLRKQVKSPTRGKNILDQILTNMSICMTKFFTFHLSDVPITNV